MRFCTHCGHELHDENFCTKCGTKTSNDTNSNPLTTICDPKFKKPLFVFIAIIVFGITILCCVLLSPRSYTELIDDYVTASVEADAEKLISLIPDSLIDYIAEEEFDGDKEEMIYDLEDTLDVFVDQLKDRNVDLKTISYEITEVEEMDEDDIDDLRDEYRRANLKIKEGKKVTIELKIPFDGQEKTRSIYIDTVKIGRVWYLIGM